MESEILPKLVNKRGIDSAADLKTGPERAILSPLTETEGETGKEVGLSVGFLLPRFEFPDLVSWKSIYLKAAIIVPDSIQRGVAH